MAETLRMLMERDTALFSEDDAIHRLESFIGIIEKTATTIENEEDRKQFVVRAMHRNITHCKYIHIYIDNISTHLYISR